MREINSKNAASGKEKAESPSVPTFGEFSKALWMVYLKNKRVKHSTVDSYSSVHRHHLFGAQVHKTPQRFFRTGVHGAITIGKISSNWQQRIGCDDRCKY